MFAECQVLTLIFGCIEIQSIKFRSAYNYTGLPHVHDIFEIYFDPIAYSLGRSALDIGKKYFKSFDFSLEYPAMS
jgi:hypothetical protein